MKTFVQWILMGLYGLLPDYMVSGRGRHSCSRVGMTNYGGKGHAIQPSMGPLLRFEIQGGCSGGLEA